MDPQKNISYVPTYQCDQMATIFVRYLAIDSKVNLPKSFFINLSK